VIFKHALSNALIPVITLLALDLPYIFTGAVLIETIFSWPGMGRLYYQAAVERNDWQTMDRILHPAFTLVLGDGKTYNRENLIEAAREKKFEFEKQVEMPGTQVVRVWGDTAVVTALLHLKGATKDGKAFDYKLWFSDTYARTPAGWKYVFGQASLPLPSENK
jgi:ketosteroid isomerase-like protein